MDLMAFAQQLLQSCINGRVTKYSKCSLGASLLVLIKECLDNSIHQKESRQNL